MRTNKILKLNHHLHCSDIYTPLPGSKCCLLYMFLLIHFWLHICTFWPVIEGKWFHNRTIWCHPDEDWFSFLRLVPVSRRSGGWNSEVDDRNQRRTTRFVWVYGNSNNLSLQLCWVEKHLRKEWNLTNFHLKDLARNSIVFLACERTHAG